MTDLSVKEVGMFLMLGEKDVLRMVKQRELPHHLIQDKIYFNKQHLIEWALMRSHPINLAGQRHFEEYTVKSILPVIDESSFFYKESMTESDYIGSMVRKARFHNPVDRDVVIQLLKSREEMMSTAIGNGIALPHPRIPLMLGQEKPIIHFFFPAQTLVLNSIDGKPVHTLILLISQTVRQHLSILAHISYLLSKKEFRELLAEQKPAGELLHCIEQLETERG